MKKAPVFILAATLLSLASHASALTVSPVKIDAHAKPGSTIGGEIELYNEQAEDKTFYTSSENFESRGDSGAPFFTDSTTGLATWFKVQPEVKVATGERVKIPYTITIPDGTKPGGYFAAIFFSGDKPKEEGGSLSIGGKVGVLFLVRADGDIKEAAGLSDFATKSGSRFFTELPVDFQYGFNNEGGDRVVPKGEFVLKNTFRMSSASIDANAQQGSVLPGSLRHFTVVWGANKDDKPASFVDHVKYQWNHFALGWYSANLNLTWGERSDAASASYQIFVFPWQLLLVVLGVLFLARTLLGMNNRRVIAAAQAAKK